MFDRSVWVKGEVLAPLTRTDVEVRRSRTVVVMLRSADQLKVAA
jgi:hypothetical protein